jgi:hypothetical protein
MTKEENGQLKMVETAIRAWVESGVHPSIIGVGLNNAFVHGKCLDKGNFEFSDRNLQDMYDGIDKFLTASNKVK